MVRLAVQMLVTRTTEDSLVWKDNCEAFPCLLELARASIACPSASVASKCLFSGGLMCDLTEENSEEPRSLLLEYNLPVIKSEY